MDLKCKMDLLQYSELEIEKILARSNKKVANVGRDIEILKNWMKQQKHFPFIFSDRQIFSFLTISHFNLEKAKTSIDLYFTLKAKIPEFYNFSPNHPKLKNFQNNYNIFPLPKLTENQGRIIISQTTDPIYFKPDYLFCSLSHIIEVLNCEDVNAGWELILDLTFASTEMLQAFTADAMIKIYFIIEKVYFNRILSIHVVTSSVSENFVETLWECSKHEMQNVMFIHKNYESLIDYFSKDLMPQDFRGNLKSLKEFHCDWDKVYQDYSDHLEKHMNARTNENLRTFQITDKEVLEFDTKIGNLLS